MKPLKVVVVVGTRPEIIRLSRVLCKLDEYCELSIIHTGQNFDYELNEIFFDDLELRRPDYFLNVASDSNSAAETIAKIISSVDSLLAQIEPDAMLVLGDTNSCLSVLSAKRRKVPIFHMEAGNRCFDLRVPEEINRKIVDHIADVNLTYSDIAREYLLREGLSADLIIKTGSPMREVINFYSRKIHYSNILEKLGLEKEAYFLISCHREENIEPPKNFRRFVELLNHLAVLYKMPIVVSTHPRTLKKLNHENSKLHQNVRLIKPQSFTDYLKLQLASKAVLSDSGTINEEASILNFPALNLREVHERPEAMEEGAVMMVGFCLERIDQALKIIYSQSRGDLRTLNMVADYSSDNVSEKVLRIVHSYTDYVNQVVWKKCD